MEKTIGAEVNVALADYDESLKNHVVELLKETLREQSVYILENTWEVVENKRTLYKNKDGGLERQDKEIPGREPFEVMTIGITVKAVETL
ncbi:MAG: hypothetical protein P4L69_18225 [Desulfosporosinus sp.]|nr:hypothetical protein [Desulfosporosinus sp.]